MIDDNEVDNVEENIEQIDGDNATPNANDDDTSLDVSKEAISDENQELAGETLGNGDNDEPTKEQEKTPMFTLEPKKADCNRDDKILLLSKKVGFIGLITCLLLSILFGAINKYWNNGLNLFFMGGAVLMYGIQEIIHLIAINKCNCSSCVTSKSKLKLVITICVIGFVLLTVLFVLRQLGMLG